eukprot:SM001899S05148  [mRNA]  locus=s1899:27:751:+ [translate_table: standard]
MRRLTPRGPRRPPGAVMARAAPVLAACRGLRLAVALCSRASSLAFNVAGSLAQVFRMRLAISLQRSLAFAVHLRAGRALASGKGSPIEDRGWKSQPKKEGTQYEKGARGSAKENKHNKKQSSYVLLEKLGSWKWVPLARASASGFRQGDVYPPASYSDLHLLTRRYLLSAPSGSFRPCPFLWAGLSQPPVTLAALSLYYGLLRTMSKSTDSSQFTSPMWRC